MNCYVYITTRVVRWSRLLANRFQRREPVVSYAHIFTVALYIGAVSATKIKSHN